MKNGEYELVRAPDDYPGKRYRGKYCYEHHLVWWKQVGEVLQATEILHHVNGQKRDNRFENLVKLSRSSHTGLHNQASGKTLVDMICPMCHNAFTRPRNLTHLVRKRIKRTFCSRSCSGRSASVMVGPTIVVRVYNDNILA